MKAGITGTRKGMTTIQWQKVDSLLVELFGGIDVTHEWHDGDCVGADEQAHGSVEHINLHRSFSQQIRLIGHPMRPDGLRAYRTFDMTFVPVAPMTRNRRLVRLIDRLIAAPAQYDEVMRGSGTWATMRYAVRQSRWRPEFEMLVVWPDGTLEIDFVPPSLRR